MCDGIPNKNMGVDNEVIVIILNGLKVILL